MSHVYGNTFRVRTLSDMRKTRTSGSPVRALHIQQPALCASTGEATRGELEQNNKCQHGAFSVTHVLYALYMVILHSTPHSYNASRSIHEYLPVTF